MAVAEAGPLPGGLVVALDDISATEWRCFWVSASGSGSPVALDDISATEWRAITCRTNAGTMSLHSMISVLPNGGALQPIRLVTLTGSCTR